MLQRVDAMESELNALTESLRTGTNRLKADLSLLQGNMSELYDASGGTPAGAGAGSAPARSSAPAPSPAASVAAAAAAEAAQAPEPEIEVDVVEIVEIEEVEIQASTGGGDDSEGARLVALDMALGGSTREETDRYLAEHYDLDDRAGLLDEVYATVEG